MPVSGLVVTFDSAVADHCASLDALRAIPEVEIGQMEGSKLAVVVDTADGRRDQEVWHSVQRLPGVVDVAVAMIAFDDESAE